MTLSWSLLLSLTRRPPPSTPSPYTTLFRSEFADHGDRAGRGVQRQNRAVVLEQHRPAGCDLAGERVVPVVAGVGVRGAGRGGAPGQRGDPRDGAVQDGLVQLAAGDGLLDLAVAADRKSVV